MLTVVARAFKTPARHTCCWERRAASAPVPHAERRADAACSFHCPLPPSPAAPTQTTPAKLSWSVLQAPALTRLPCGNCTAPSVGAGLLPGHPETRLQRRARGSTVSRVARLLRVFDRLPTRSFASSRHGPTGFAALRRVKQGRPVFVTPPRDSSNPVAFGHMRRRRLAALWNTRAIPFRPSSCRKAGRAPERP